MWIQKEIALNPRNRGYHLITDEVVKNLPEIKSINVGILTLFIKHTSASLTINENADITVRNDFESHFNIMVPENAPYYQHTFEGSDDMPAHIKSALTNNQISLSVKSGKLLLGTWQGLYLFEHRLNSQTRKIIHHFIGE